MLIYVEFSSKSRFPPTLPLGAGLGIRAWTISPTLHLSFLSLPTSFPYPPPQLLYPQGSPTLQQAKTNMGGGIMERQPWVLNQDFLRLEERASYPPRAWEEEGPSGAT
jgi:hypothetical protein